MNKFTPGKTGIYLDNAATTSLSASMKKYLLSILDLYGNPSSLHSVGKPVKQILSKSRQSAADFINADPKDIFFTPSGSASSALAIRGYGLKHNCTILYSPIAHKSILEYTSNIINSYPLMVDNHGFIDFDYLKKQLDDRRIKPFVIIDHANSEIGVIQDVKKIIDLVHAYNGIVYLDCTGSIPSMPVNAKQLNADMLAFSAHKLGGLKGCGLLYKKSSVVLEPLIYGSQEGGLSAGTENVLGIASLGKAVSEYDYSSVSSANRDYIYGCILKNIPDCYLAGPPITSKNRLPNNLYMCFQGVEGESLAFLLDMYNIQVSTGSACNGGNQSASAVLTAIGMNREDIPSCIRLTFSGKETKEELDYVCDQLKECIETLRKLNTL